jgi:hypothetical protein
LNTTLILEDEVMKLLQTKGSLVPSNNASNNMFTEVKLLVKWKKVKPASAKKLDLLAAYYVNPPPPSLSLCGLQMMTLTLPHSSPPMWTCETQLWVS